MNNKNIFLIDGIGAILSAITLGITLPLVQSWIGLPLNILFTLAFLACVFATYSLSCFRWADHNNHKWLGFIMTANTAYCLLTSGLIFLHIQQITKLGIAYFVVEIIIILALVNIERKIFLQVKKTNDNPQ